MGGWDIPETNGDPSLGLEEPDYGKFENVSMLAIALKCVYSTILIGVVDPTVHPSREALRLLQGQKTQLLYHSR